MSSKIGMLIFKCEPYWQFSYIGDIYIILVAQYTFCNLHILIIVDIVDDTFDTTEKEIEQEIKERGIRIDDTFVAKKQDSPRTVWSGGQRSG